MIEIAYDLRTALDITIAKLSRATLEATVWEAKCIALQAELAKRTPEKPAEGVG